jgi:hypothetical protein
LKVSSTPNSPLAELENMDHGEAVVADLGEEDNVQDGAMSVIADEDENPSETESGPDIDAGHPGMSSCRREYIP